MVTYEKSKLKVIKDYKESKKKAKKAYAYLKTTSKCNDSLDLFHISQGLGNPSMGDDLWDFDLKNTDKRGNKQFNMELNSVTRNISTIWKLNAVEKKKWLVH